MMAQPRMEVRSPAQTDDVSLCSAALSSADESVLTVSMTNKSEMEPLGYDCDSQIGGGNYENYETASCTDPADGVEFLEHLWLEYQ